MVIDKINLIKNNNFWFIFKLNLKEDIALLNMFNEFQNIIAIYMKTFSSHFFEYILRKIYDLR